MLAFKPVEQSSPLPSPASCYSSPHLHHHRPCNPHHNQHKFTIIILFINTLITIPCITINTHHFHNHYLTISHHTTIILICITTAIASPASSPPPYPKSPTAWTAWWGIRRRRDVHSMFLMIITKHSQHDTQKPPRDLLTGCKTTRVSVCVLGIVADDIE